MEGRKGTRHMAAQRNRQLYRRQSTSHRLRLAPHPSHTNRSAKAESSPRTLDDSPAERAERRSGVHARSLTLLHLGPNPTRTDDIRRRCLGGSIRCLHVDACETSPRERGSGRASAGSEPCHSPDQVHTKEDRSHHRTLSLLWLDVRPDNRQLCYFDPGPCADVPSRPLGFRGGILYDSMDRSCTFRVSGESDCVQLGPAGYSSSVSSLELHFIFSKRANRPRRTNSNRVSC